MKKLLLILLFIVFAAQPCLGAINPSIDDIKTWKNAYRFTNKPKDTFLGWCVAIEDAVDGETTGVPSVLFSGLATATGEALTTAGTIFYDSTTSNLKYYTTSWNTIASSDSSTLDEAYDAGTAITADAGAVAITVSDASDNAGITVAQNDATNNSNGIEVTMCSSNTGAGLYINGTTGTVDLLADNWTVPNTGIITAVGGIFSSDVTFDCTTAAGKDVEWDDSSYTFHILDNTILGIGGATTAAADIAIRWDETDIDVLPAATNAIWKWGNGTNDLDMWWYGGAAGDYMWWDESGAELLFVDAHIGLADDGTLTFGTGDDWVIASATTKILQMTPAQSDGTNQFAIGTATYTSDVLIYGETASTVAFDAIADKVTFDAYDIMISDGDILEFGDTTATDIDVYFDGTKNQLEILDNDGDTTLQILGFEAKEARLILAADEDDEATDQWEIASSTSGTLTIGNDCSSADTFVDHLTIAATTGNLTLIGDIVNEGGETLVMSTDDSIILTSDDNNATFQIQGNANAKSAILDLSADAAADDVDTWSFTVADGGALTVANDSTATMTVAEAMDITGTITLADDEVLSNASDVVDITGDDGATTFAIRGCTGDFSAVLEISADDAADDADTWLFTVADGGALSIANDGTATMTINEVVDFTSTITLANDEVLANDADDEVSVTSNDNNTTFAIRGNANAKSAILELSGDDAADDADTWLFTVADGGALTIANDSSATMTIGEKVIFSIGANGTAFDAVADDADGAGNSIPAGTSVVNISAVTNGANDWVALPVGVLGERIHIIATVACELRTLATTDDEINEQDCDGTKEYQLTAGDIVDLICVEAGARWTAVSHTILGAAKTIVPDA